MTDTPEGVDLDRLQPWFAAHVDGATGAPLDAALISGGRSNLTYAISEPTARTHEWVLRRPPLGHVLPTAHDMAREYKVLTALAATEVPVPRTLAFCDDVAVNDAPFYVMEQGRRADPAHAGRDGRASPPTTPAAAPKRWSTCSSRSTPSTTTRSASATSAIPTATSSARCGAGASSGSGRRPVTCRPSTSSPRRLRAALPESPAPTIVHGDYRLDNTMLAPDDPGTIVAVLDWEMATLGDPLADLGLFLLYWKRDEGAGRQRSARRSTAEAAS